MKLFSILVLPISILVSNTAGVHFQQKRWPGLISTQNIARVRGYPATSSQHLASLRLIRRIPLEGVVKRIDHLAVNPTGQQLFVAALGNNTLEVIDLKSGRRSGSIPDLKEPQGVAYVPDLDRIFVANGESGHCAIFEAASLKLFRQILVGEDADNVRYDAAARQIFVGYGAGALGILDARSGERLGDVSLAGHPESFQLEKGSPRIFVNVPNAGHIAVVDRIRRTVVTTWHLERAASNFPMGLDEPAHRLFVGCRNPATLLVYDTSNGKETGRLSIGGDTDDLFWDAKRKRLYVICGAGVICSFQEDTPGRFIPMAETITAPGARTGLFVAETNSLYVAVPRRGILSAEVQEYSVQP